jgi:serine/threonine protein kinase
MGAVYRAEDCMLHRQVAYKIVPENILGTEVEPETLLEEARAAARLSHTNIVQVYDVGRHGEGFFVVMELVTGQNLDAILSQQQMSVIGAVRVGRQVCAALAHAHERRIIHRDLKPSNLLWDGKRIRLTDFGLARAFEEGVGHVATQPAGTPSYMAPEQIRGEALSPRADLYAFGCLLFEMLCQKPVFGTGPSSLHRHLSIPPDDPRQHRAEVPEALAVLVTHCLAKDPAERPASAAEIGRRLATIQKELEGAG